jgi:hypothetical protein
MAKREHAMGTRGGSETRSRGYWVAAIVGGSPGTGEWKDLCGLWSGNVETGEGGLRLGIKGRVSAYVVWEAVDGNGGVSVTFREPGNEGADIGDY